MTGHEHHGCESEPTLEQQATADRFVAESRDAMTSRGWYDCTTALADGYVPISGAEAHPTQPFTGNLTGHFVNFEYFNDGRVLDPERPEVLWFGPDGQLWAFMFTVREVVEEPAPTPAGCLMSWHVHGGMQAVALKPPTVTSGATAGQSCWHDLDTLPTLHVFTAETVEEFGGENPFDQGSIPPAPNRPLTTTDHPHLCEKPSSEYPDDAWGSGITWAWSGDN